MFSPIFFFFFLQAKHRTMIILQRCHRRLAGIVGGSLSRNASWPDLALLKYADTNHHLWPEVRTLSILSIHNKHKRKVDLGARTTVHSLLRTENALKHEKLADLQQNRHLGIAAKLVNNASPRVQPYMKLMRIDKPIGETDVYILAVDSVISSQIGCTLDMFPSKFFSQVAGYCSGPADGASPWRLRQVACQTSIC